MKQETLRACRRRQARSAVSRDMPMKFASKPCDDCTTLRRVPSSVAISVRAVRSRTFSAW